MKLKVSNMRVVVCVMVCVIGAVVISCFQGKESLEPKPLGYFRIDLPAHQYRMQDTLLPFTFEQSCFSNLIIKSQPHGVCWVNVDYPQLNATIRFTYLPIKNADSLRKLIVEEEKMVKFHYQKADNVEFSIIRDEEARVWGQTYDIEGKEVATPFQFWMTDSAHHFLRATIYFNFAPNNDSLQPVISYLREDAMHLIGTFNWR